MAGRFYEPPKQPTPWKNTDERTFYTQLVDVLDELHLPVKEEWLDAKLRRKITEGGSTKQNYSTEEQDTGIKYINGEPIYCKTFIVNLPDGTIVDVAVQDCAEIIRYEGYARRKTYDVTLPINCYYSNVLNCIALLNNGNLRLRFTGSGGATGYVTIYYTKGTQQNNRVFANTSNEQEMM